MPIDSFTVVLFGFLIKLLLGGTFIVFWLKSRDAFWFAWWSASLLFGSLTSLVFLLSGVTASFAAIAFGNATLIVCVACCWQGARAFNKREPWWMPVLAVPALWLAACLVPAIIENVGRRIMLSSLLIALMLAMSAAEFWRGRAEKLPSRWPVIVIFSSFALSFAIRVPLTEVLPFPFGALPLDAGWLGAFNLVMFGHTVLLSVLLVSMSKERLELDQRTKAQTDPLTGALNRRAFIARGERILARHQHDRAPLCLLFLDLDHFKSLNDKFGHSGGDDVLIRFVDLVSASIRPSDYLFRIGGEEFCCLLPNTGLEQAHRVAERIRHQFETAVLEVAGSRVKATVSLGIASTEMFGYDLDTLMRRSDMAVYAAKRAGRNRVEVATAADAAACSDAASLARGAVLAR